MSKPEISFLTHNLLSHCIF